MHGENDRRVPVKQAQILTEKLKGNGTVVELVVFKQDDHELTSNTVRSHQMICNWFVKYLH